MTTASTIGTPEAARGLTSTDAMQRLAISGPNALPKTTPPTLLARVAKQLVNPLSVILLVAGFITIVVLRRSGEGASILVIVVINTAMAVGQERAANDAMAALEQLVAPTSKVWRDGLVQEILAEGLVADDLIELAAGDRVPADARVAQSSLMAVDEAMLTGESLPVDKIAQDQVFAGTLVVRGSGQGVVTATGAATKLGQIATAMEKPTDPPLVRQLSVNAAQVSVLAIVVGVLVGIGTYLRSAGQQQRTAEAVLTGVALAIAAIPEGLSSVVLSALALGTRRMAKRGVIVRRLPAIEALGSTSVLCADKTGTITSGHLEVVDLLVQPGLDEEFWTAVTRANDAVGGIGDPLDIALLDAVPAPHRATVAAQVGERIDSRPFSAETRSMSTIHESRGTAHLSVKGAPESILSRCATAPDVTRLSQAVEALAGRGLRVLAVADATTDDLDAGLRPLGLVAFGDPLRPSAIGAVADCRRAGIRVVMVTGDHATTAGAVAEAVGILDGPAQPHEVIDGAALATMTPEAAAAALLQASVVARVEPNVKTALVDAHRARGAIVAMTGDGVNDAPALRRADVGVAIAGSGGTDVARRAASIIVTDGDLGTIAAGVAEGRRIARNLGNVVRYLLTGNLTEVLVVTGALVVLPDLRTPLLPAQLLWINLITDGLPGLALGTDEPVGDPLADPPRPRSDHLLNRTRLLGMVFDALVITAIGLGASWWTDTRWGWTPSVVRSSLLLTLIACHLLLAYVARARHFAFEPAWWRAKPMLASIVGSILLQVVAYTTPTGRELLGLSAVPPVAWLIAGGAAISMVGVLDVRSAVLRRHGG